jgi:ubiquinone/menaquinone biosynthesis C-methylase UbiE
MNNDMLRYYSTKSEKERLSDNSLEKLRSQELILRHLPAHACKIADIGGAAGVYSFWLQQLGHEVHLVDAMPNHVEEAKVRAAQLNQPLASIAVGDARQLDFADSMFDIVLLMGPLYHIIERTDRITALSEARRILKQGGIVITVGISRYASMMDGFIGNLVEDPDFVQIMNQDLTDGQHRSHADEKYFTTAFFHLPDELLAEVVESGFSNCQLFAIESFGDYIPELPAKWTNVQFQQTLLKTICKVEGDSAMMGISPHIMAVGVKV